MAALRSRISDPALAMLLAGATGVSILACVITALNGATLAYADAVSHLLITGRVLGSSTPGAAQLGGVWLPLPHLLAAPFVLPEPWYYSGFGACLVSMVSYVGATGWLYRTGLELTGDRAAGLTGALVFATNPNVLYLQSTPMTELPLFGCVTAAIYFLARWCRTGEVRHLVLAALAMLLATLVRYEGWVLLLAMTLVVVWNSWRRHRHRGRSAAWTRARADLVLFGCLSGGGVGGWLAWNQVIFGDPLNFLRGDFAQPELWVRATDKVVGDWSTSLWSYLYAVGTVLGPATSAAAAVGLLYYLWRTRLRAGALAPITLLVLVPFFVYALYSGQRPLRVREFGGELYNVRFGLVLIIPAALCIGFLVVLLRSWRRVRWLGGTVLPLGVVTASTVLGTTGIATMQEPMGFQASQTARAHAASADWLRTHYDHGRVLMQSWNNERVSFGSRIPLDKMVYEGSYRQWRPALADPAAHGIRWIHLGRAGGVEDVVWRSLHDSPRLAESYTLVYQDSARQVYRRSDGLAAAIPESSPAEPDPAGARPGPSRRGGQ